LEARYPKGTEKKKIIRKTYTEMVIEAIGVLNEKEGSSLQAIRKYLLTNFDVQIGRQHSASFNSLTLKAVTRSLATGDLEQPSKVKRTYRLSATMRKKRELLGLPGGTEPEKV
jgi:hypothetical protein